MVEKLPALRAEVALTPTDETTIEAVVRALPHPAEAVLWQYLSRLRPATRERHVHDLAVLCHFLLMYYQIQADPAELEGNLLAWQGLPVDSDLARSYLLWQQEDGYALGSVGVRFDTFKAYCRLLLEAGLIDPISSAQINAIKPVRVDAYRTVDENRARRGILTRKPDAKKADWVLLSTEQVNMLLDHIGVADEMARRDNLLVRLSWIYALRVSEMCLLRLDSLDAAGILTFDRIKNHLYDQHIRLTGATFQMMRVVIEDRRNETTLGEEAPLFASFKPNAAGAQERPALRQVLSARVCLLAKRHLGIEHVSLHDGRHRYATVALADPRNTLAAVMDAAGWKTPAMPMRYRQRAAIANDQVISLE
jgi:integrase